MLIQLFLMKDRAASFPIDASRQTCAVISQPSRTTIPVSYCLLASAAEVAVLTLPLIVCHNLQPVQRASHRVDI